jgi:hypothetical protein
MVVGLRCRSRLSRFDPNLSNLIKIAADDGPQGLLWMGKRRTTAAEVR